MSLYDDGSQDSPMIAALKRLLGGSPTPAPAVAAPASSAAQMPTNMADLQGLLSQMQPNQADQDAARKRAILTMGLGLLGAPKGGEFQAIGRGGLLGMQAYQQQLHDAPKMRLDALKSAMEMQTLMRKMQYGNELDDSQPAGPSMPPPTTGAMDMSGSAGTGLPNTPPMPQQLPQLSQRASGSPKSIIQQLRDMGVPEVAIKTARMAPDPDTAVAALVKEYSQPVFGQGKIPLMRGPGGTFRAVVPEGFNDALAAQAGAETTAQEGAKAKFDLVDVPDGKGGTVKMPRSQALQALGGQQAQPQAWLNVNLDQGARTPENMAAIATQLAKSRNIPLSQAAQMVEQAAAAGNQFGRAPGPAEIHAANAATDTKEQATRSALNTEQDVTKPVFDDVRKEFVATRNMANHAKNMEALDARGVFSGPAGKLTAQFANTWNSAFPGSSVSVEKLANTQTAAAEVSRMQQALGKAFPGQQSNYELQTVTNALPQLIYSPEGRAQIYTAIRNASALAEKNYVSASRFMVGNKGSLVGWKPEDMGASPFQSGGWSIRETTKK